ncbi:hypothetical protein J4N42_16965 [Vibrio sp. SCSIO 43135]|uniref:hypothetical protein n=1 Tax=Vibrio sp. SCSIO 43135 TaxID=2819096 RepID=UPI002075EBC6|nr:hypothetical protein [Vibrio sp. SCSIO 43135]USD43848.1 hypothetical protein J4N42_16965 [Vibrio sp. SCSIO 43135]
MRALLILLTLSAGLYLFSESYYRSHISIGGEYRAHFSDLRKEGNKLYEVIKASITEDKFTTDVYLKEEGIDSVSVFHSKGKFLRFKHGTYRYSAQITAEQKADISNLEASEEYGDMLLRSITEEKDILELLYLDKHIAIVSRGQKRHISLYVRIK